MYSQVCRMASDYSRTCVSPDSIQTGETPMVSESCEVYVWGSNSSHQLVEGTQEKILQPKLAPSFADAQTVSNSEWLCPKPLPNRYIGTGKYIMTLYRQVTHCLFTLNYEIKIHIIKHHTLFVM